MQVLFALVLAVFCVSVPSWADSELTPSPVLIFSTVHAHTRFTVGPVINGDTRLELRFMSSTDHVPVQPDGTLSVALFMESMGHGSTPTVVSVVTGGEPGIYEISQMNFFMGGRWRVDVTLTYADGQQEIQSFDVELLQ